MKGKLQAEEEAVKTYNSDIPVCSRIQTALVAGETQRSRGGNRPGAMSQLPRGVTLGLAVSVCRSTAALFPPPSGKP